MVGEAQAPTKNVAASMPSAWTPLKPALQPVSAAKMKSASGVPAAAALSAELMSVAMIGYGTSWTSTPASSSTFLPTSALWVMDPNSP